MQISGHLKKMRSQLIMGMAEYQLPIDDNLLNINDLLGEKISLEFDGKIHCANCGRLTKKSYSQGYCYTCCQSLASCDLCILKPEKCHHYLGTCREPTWGLDNCFKPHTVYLSVSSAIKVGITRSCNIPSRWIDQGAVQALPILEVDNRFKSGQIEVALKHYVSDKTNQIKMLKNDLVDANLIKEKDSLIKKIPDIITHLGAHITDNSVLEIDYPVIKYSEKINQLSFDKTPNITGVLNGIKGQYLILDSGVLNIRKFISYSVTLTY